MNLSSLNETDCNKVKIVFFPPSSSQTNKQGKRQSWTSSLRYLVLVATGLSIKVARSVIILYKKNTQSKNTKNRINFHSTVKNTGLPVTILPGDLKPGTGPEPSGKLQCRAAHFECTKSNQVAQQSSLQGEHSTLLRFRGGDVPAQCTKEEFIDCT